MLGLFSVCLWRAQRALCGVLFACGGVAAQPNAPIDQHLAQIQALIQSGGIAAAKAELRKASAAVPNDPRVWNLQGVVAAMENDFPAAESSFVKATRLAPKFTGAYLNLGRLYQQHTEQPRARENALATYRRLLTIEPGHVEANYQAARLLSQQGAAAESLQHLERLPPQAQQRAAALALLCADSTLLGKGAEADRAAAQLLAAPDFTEADVLEITPVLLAKGKDDRALQLLHVATARPQASAAAWEQLAKVYEKRGQWKNARTALEKALPVSQPPVPLLLELAWVTYRIPDLEGALGYLAHARDRDPSNAVIHFFFGMVCVDLKLPPEAKKSLAEAVRLNPANPEYHYALGAVLVNEKNADEAIPHFEKYRQAHPNDPRGGFALGVAQYEAYRLNDAKATLQSVSTASGTQMGAELYLARVALREENLDEAQTHLQKAIRANSQSPEPYAELALIHIRRNEFPLAEQNLTQALKLAPDHYLSNLRLSMLYQRTKDARAAAQAKRVEQLQKAGEDREKLLLRSLEIQPN